MSKENIIVHIGLHKTGTTFLQTHVFPKIESLSIIRAWFTHRQITNIDFKDNLLITDEGISGVPWNGNYYDDFKSNIKKIKYLYGDVKIVFGIRKHEEFILSLYKQYLHQKGFKDIEHIFNIKNTGILKSNDLFFNERILLLKDEFSDVFVYDHEFLKAQPLQFFNSLFSFMNVSSKFDFTRIIAIKENVGVSTKIQVRWLIKLNKINNGLSKILFLPSLYNSSFVKHKLTPRDICQYRLAKIKSEKFELPSDMKKYIKAYYTEDWAKSLAYINH